MTANARIVRFVSFSVAAGAYDRFMGRYSALLAPLFADFAGMATAPRVLDVGCGPGALTAELVKRFGAGSVSAVEPSEQFFSAVRERFPAVSVRQAPAEHIPFEDGAFDAALAQLVVHFMTDPVAGLREMRRVTRGDGVVAACVWDHDGGSGPLGAFWEAVQQLDPQAENEGGLAGAREGHLGELLQAAGLREIVQGALSVGVEHATFEDWWEPFTLGVGPAGVYVTSLDAQKRAELRERCRTMLPAPPFVVSGRAWAARGTV